jgi:hypothetical protein
VVNAVVADRVVIVEDRIVPLVVRPLSSIIHTFRTDAVVPFVYVALVDPAVGV